MLCPKPIVERPRLQVADYTHASAECVATKPSSYTFVARRRELLHRSYFKSALRFLRGVAVEQRKSQGERSDVAIRLIWVIDDDASLPRELQQELKFLNVFILGHSINANCFTDESVVLAPNFHFINRDGFKPLLRNLREREIPFDERKPDVFWRGATTGMVSRCNVEDSARVDVNQRVTACVKLPRVRAAQSSINVPWLDVTIMRRVQSCRGQTNERTSLQVSEQHWITHKGILEIDGNVDARGNRWGTESGSVLFLVKSNFKHFYSDQLVDGVHFVGISEDLHDLAAKNEDRDEHRWRIPREVARNCGKCSSVHTRIYVRARRHERFQSPE